MIQTLRAALTRFAHRRAQRLAERAPGRAEAWLRRACRWAPTFDPVHAELIAARRRAGDPLGAVDVARRAATRFDETADAWVALGQACTAAFRTRDALVAFERALQIEERGDAAMAAGTLYRRMGDPATAGARFARAYAAGAGPDALRENARALLTTGDAAAAREAITLWERETGLVWKD
jgi:tetratricopeptide (TPR) repeat protein